VKTGNCRGSTGPEGFTNVGMALALAVDCANGAGTPAAADPLVPTGLTGVNASEAAALALVATFGLWVLEFDIVKDVGSLGSRTGFVNTSSRIRIRIEGGRSLMWSFRCALGMGDIHVDATLVLSCTTTTNESSDTREKNPLTSG